MLRDKNLIPLSHQHQRALALCVRIDRASPIPIADLDAWQTEIAQLFESEIRGHFTAEEQVIFPAARRFPTLVRLVEELLVDHATLREDFGRAEGRSLSPSELAAFAGRLSIHIRKEERQLFEKLQDLMEPDEIAQLGKQLESALRETRQVCAVPTEATRLRPAK
jgi:hemerythrin-like domain-containing protein